MSREVPPAFFRRFRPPNREEILREIEADRHRLAEARSAGDDAAELGISIALGFHAYVTEGEAEAAPLLDRAVVLARQLGDRTAEIEALLHLATARQYLGMREQAQHLFHEALERSNAYGIDEFDHFILHHQGRCWVEQGDYDAARRCFERALALREPLGIARFIESSRGALEELTALR